MKPVKIIDRRNTETPEEREQQLYEESKQPEFEMHMAYASIPDDVMVMCSCKKCQKARATKPLPDWYKELNHTDSRAKTFTGETARKMINESLHGGRKSCPKTSPDA